MKKIERDRRVVSGVDPVDAFALFRSEWKRHFFRFLIASVVVSCSSYFRPSEPP